MARYFEIKVDDAKFKEIERALGFRKFLAPKVVSGAINKTIAKGKTQISRRIAAEMSAPTGKVKRWVKIIRATPERLVGHIKLLGFRLKMSYTKKIPIAGGSYALRMVGEPQQIQNTPFKQKMLSGHIGWFVRTSPKRKMEKGRYAGKIREPVEEIYADSPESLFRNAPANANEELEKVAADLERQISSQIDRYLAQ